MVFSDLLFIFRFLPFALIVYFLAPRFLKNGVLLMVSLIFYGWGEPKYILIMFVSIIVDYLASSGIEKHRNKKSWMRFFLSLSIISNLGMLTAFKYSNFFIDQINSLFGTEIASTALALPLGISFYTFQTMSYTLDVYFGRVKAERNFIDFGAYVCLFPQLIAGPIVKYVDIQKALKSRKPNAEQIDAGIRFFILGLSSKVLIANNVGMLWQDVQSIGFENISMPLAWLGILAFAFQIYFDFNGYSLMAIGLGKILGFEFPRNFDDPYAARSITEFWRRWHMTLGEWFRMYVYIPLGGNRKGIWRQILNLLIVWFLTGFWHGASWNFILWGMYFAFICIIEKVVLLKYLKKYVFMSHFYTIFLVLISWVIFALPNFSDIHLFYSRLFSLEMQRDYVYALRNYGVTFMLATLFSTPFVKKIYTPIKKNPMLLTVVLITLFLVNTSYLVDSGFNPFLYFRF